MKDIYGHVIPTIEDETMAHFDTTIRGDFGNTPAILEAASKDLAAENQAAAAEDYGRGVSLHESCDYREAALKAQIDRLIMQSNSLVYRLSHKVNAHEPINSTEFINMTGDLHKEIDVAMELIK